MAEFLVMGGQPIIVNYACFCLVSCMSCTKDLSNLIADFLPQLAMFVTKMYSSVVEYILERYYSVVHV